MNMKDYALGGWVLRRLIQLCGNAKGRPKWLWNWLYGQTGLNEDST